MRRGIPRMRATALDWLAGIREIADARIASGDLDLDDWVYRSREAANTLLEIWGVEDDK